MEGPGSDTETYWYTVTTLARKLMRVGVKCDNLTDRIPGTGLSFQIGSTPGLVNFTRKDREVDDLST